MKSIWARIQTEPALVSGFVAAALSLAAAYGVNLSGDQIGTILAIVTAGLAFLVRSQVTPTAALVPLAAVTAAAVEQTLTALTPPSDAPTPVAPDPTPPTAG